MKKLGKFMNITIKIFSSFFICILLSGCVKSIEKVSENAPYSDRLSSFDKWITTLDKDQDISASLLFFKGGKKIYQRAAGKVHPLKGEQLHTDSSFNLASVSKQFTAMGIMLLEHQSKLRFDVEVKNYIPNFPYSGITVRHLLHHTSGLVDYMELADEYWQEDEMFTNKDMLIMYQQYKPDLLFMPGEKFEYSNTGYVMLSIIIEHITQQSFEDFIQDNIFNPLNMTHSRVINLLSNPNSLSSRVYGQDDGELNDLINLDGATGDGAVYSSTSDLIHWHKALIEYKLIPKEKQLQAFQPAKLNDGSLSYYGFGWLLNKEKPAIKMWHTGGWVGFRTVIWRDVSTDSVFIILSSDSGGVEFSELYKEFVKLARAYQSVKDIKKNGQQ